jgi:hypothetical protein
VVSVAEKPADAQAAPPAQRAQPRTPEQEEILRQHLALVREMYADRDPRLVRELEDDTVLWTDDLADMFGITAQRIHMLYISGRDLFDAGYLIHPAGIPVADTFGELVAGVPRRGVTRGRMALWALGAHRAIWNPDAGTLSWIKSDSTASQVERALKALRRPQVSGDHRVVLEARVAHPEKTTTEIASLLGMTKAQFTSRLRRALVAAERT